MKFLITRSEPHATELAAALHAKSVASESVQTESIQTETIQTVAVPVMSIVPLALSGEARSHLMNLDLFDMVIVISSNAADLLGYHLDQYWPQLPVSIDWVAIGKATAQTLVSQLDELSASQIHTPNGTDSEALMMLPVFESMVSKKVLLVKGEGGRDVIHQTLTQRGAKVTELELYRRTADLEQVDRLVNAFKSGITHIQIASGESFIFLLEVLKAYRKPSASELNKYLWLVPSERVAKLLSAYFINPSQILVCNGASNQAIVNCLNTLF